MQNQQYVTSSALTAKNYVIQNDLIDSALKFVTINITAKVYSGSGTIQTHGAHSIDLRMAASSLLPYIVFGRVKLDSAVRSTTISLTAPSNYTFQSFIANPIRNTYAANG